MNEAVSTLVSMLDDLTPEERLEVFSAFCKFCGSDDPDCQCWNDEQGVEMNTEQLNDDRILDARDMAEEIAEMKSANELELAAEAFRMRRVTTDPFPATERVYHLLLEVAFMEGAQWATKQNIDKLEKRLEVLNAQL